VGQIGTDLGLISSADIAFADFSYSLRAGSSLSKGAKVLFFGANVRQVSLLTVQP
jgi:hypothetical protein